MFNDAQFGHAESSLALLFALRRKLLFRVQMAAIMESMIISLVKCSFVFHSLSISPMCLQSELALAAALPSSCYFPAFAARR